MLLFCPNFLAVVLGELVAKLSGMVALEVTFHGSGSHISL